MSSVSTGEVELRTAVRELTGKDIGTEFEAFETRLVFQKIMYLLCSAKAVRPAFTFGFHLYGPYSKDWAEKGFHVKDGGKFSVELLPSVAKVDKLARGRSANELVAFATLHYYHKRMNLSRDASRKRATEDHKLTVLQHFDSAWTALESVNWLS